MTTVERRPATAMFSVVRKGFDHEQVTRHLDRLAAEMKILSADGASAMEQSSRLAAELESTRKELEAARAEADRLRADLRTMGGPPDTVDSMNQRLRVLLRLSRDEFGERRVEVAAQAAAHAAEIIAGVGEQEAAQPGLQLSTGRPRWRDDDVERDVERQRLVAAQERARLDDLAAARRAAADEEFRRTLALRCREAMDQFASMQAEARRTAQQVLDDADVRAKALLSEAGEAVRQNVDEARREVGVLHTLRARLTHQLDETRQLLNGNLAQADPAPDDAVPAPAAVTD